MRVLVDTNVVLDLLLDRAPFSKAATRIIAQIEQSRIDASLCATTITTIEYILGQSMPSNKVRSTLYRLFEMFDIATVNRSVIHEALQSKMRDFEDAVLAYSAKLAGVDIIVTRNVKDFKHSPVKTLDPQEFLAVINCNQIV